MKFYASILQSVYELSLVTYNGVTYWGCKFNFSQYGRQDELWLYSINDGTCRCKHKVGQDEPYYYDCEVAQ
jgi:hypothetical protein